MPARIIPVTARAFLLIALFVITLMPAKAAVPTFTSATPNSACSNNFGVVVITGNHFTGSTVVKFNGTNAASFTVVSNTEIDATPGAGTTTGTISVTNGSGTGTSGFNFTVNAAPVAAIGPVGPSSFCGSGTLTASGGGTYQWNATGGSATTAAITAAASGTYTVTVTNAAGCTAAASNVVTVNPNPSAAITPAGPSSFCVSGGLTASGGGTYLWNATGGGSTSATIAASASGTYTVTVTTTSTGCTASASNVVTVNPLPAAPTAVTATPATICAGATSQIKATSAGNTINWWTAASGGTLLGNSASGANYAVTPATTTTYYAEALTGAGCVSASRVAVTVNVNPVPSAAITPAGPSSFCGSGTLTASGGGTYLWNAIGGGGTGTAITASASGTYTVTVTTTATGCTAAASNVVTINANPTATITPAGPSSFCASGGLTASGGGTYLWNALGGGGTGAAITASASGTYTVTVTSGAGCTATASNAVTINPVPAAPTAVTATPATICAGATSQINATSAGNIIKWWTASSGGTLVGTSTSGVNFAVTPASTTTYYAEANTATCASATRVAVTVTVNTVPTAVTVNTPGTYCGSTTLTAAGGTGGTIYWENTTNNGTSTVTPSTSQLVSASGTYYFRAENVCGWGTQGSAAITINALPAVSPITGGNAVCVGSTLTLSDATLLGTWSASNATATVSILGVVTGVSAGIDTISYTTAPALFTGCTNTTTQIVTVNPLPSASITPASPSSFCGSGSLTASGGGNYLWNAAGGGSTLATITASTSGTYVVTVTTPATGCTASSSNNVTVNPIPAAPTSVTASPASICVGQSSNLTGTSAGNTIRWWTAASGGTLLGTSASGANYSVSPASTTIYYAEAYTAAGCISATRTAVTVTVHTLPVVGVITGTTTVCAGATTPLSDTTAGGTWTSGSPGIATINASTGLVTGVSAGSSTISYTVTNAFGCVTVVTTSITVNAIPALTTNNATSCSGGSVILRTIAGATAYHWTTGATVDSIITATVGTYTVTVTNAAGCTASVNDTVTSSNPVITVNNPAKCAGGTDTLIATGGGAGATYIWSTGSLRDSIFTTTAGVYKVTVTNSVGCSATASGIATINPLPTPVVDNILLCPGSLGTLTTNSGALYAWSNGSNTASTTVASAGIYTVTVTNSGSCTAVASDTVTAAIAPTPSVTSASICSGSPATLTASGGNSYIWNTGATTRSISTTTAGTYTITATSIAGCTATASGTATTASNPTPTVNSPTICNGVTTTLTATGGASYLWSTGASTMSISVTPSATTTYTVTATNASGCSATASGTVTVNALPTPTVNNGVVCSGASTILTATGGTGYHWSTGATTASISTGVIGTYTVTATNAAGCTASVSGTVTAAVAPVATVNSVSACSGTSSVLTATITAGGPCTYLWSTAATSASITVSPASTTTYTVTVTNTSGCTANASGTITVYPLPAVTATSNSPILLNGTINLTSTTSGGTSPYTYSWSGPSAYTSAAANPTIASAQPSNAGIYNITVTDNHSCTAKANTTVVLNFIAPGGIPSNDALWLNANYSAVTSGSNLTAWDDLSGLGNNATTINGTAPTLINNSINSYPVVNFAGNGGLKGAFGTAITSSAVSAFIVAQISTASGSASGLFSIAASGASTDSATTNTNSAVLFERGNNEIFTERNAGIRGNYSNANAIGQYHLETSIFANSGTVDNYFYSEGAAANNVAYAATAFNDALYTVGSRYIGGAASSYLTGQIAEVILYNTQLTVAQKNQVESYLALKYGFTLNQSTATNYVATDGGIFWNAASNGTYNHNIFGVGWDNIDSLKQTQSVSINTNQLSINSATGLSFYSFLMVSDNGVADTLDHVTGLPNNINAALTTVWRASQTGSRITANFVLNKSTVNFNYYAPISASMTPYMLIDSNHDGIYETYVAASSTSGSNVTFNYSLNDAALFTFGFKASIDYGDAWGVPTLTAKNGAGHMIVPGVYLGSLIDAELDGQPSVNAVGDDTIGLADEDGVNFNIGVPTTNNIVTMGTNTITVTASVPGYLNAWADLNQDGTYGGGSEYEIQNLHLVAGPNIVTFNVSDSVLYGPTSMRFRFDTINGDVTGPTGLAKNGEVEDYLIYVTAPLVGACTNGFQNPSFEQGPDIGAGTYIITSQSNLPYWRTTAADGMIEQWGNNFNGGGVNVPAYNGTYFVELEANLYGALYQDVYTTPGTKLSWSFAHRGRFGNDTCLLKIGTPQNPITQGQFIDGEFAWGVHTGFYTVPAGQYITRLAFDAVGSFGGNQSEGNFLDDVSVISSFDYGDAPNSYGTYFANSGPYHSITNNLYLGYGVTCDADGQPSAAANRDSLDDGVTFPLPCNGCGTYTVSLAIYNNSGSNATVAGWIDFNKNGVFDNNERASITVPTRATEIDTTLTFAVTAFSAASTNSYGRFRIANDSTQIATPYGFAASGEVEDYLIPCVSLPVPIPTISSPVCARGPLTLAASDSAYRNIWSGPNGFTSYSKDTTIASIPQADSGLYTIYAVYSNGCVTDSPVNIKVSNCYANVSGAIFDDANGNGLIDGTDATTDLGRTVYAVITDNTNTVLATTLIAPNGTFSLANLPAYESGMTVMVRTTNPAVGGPSGGPLWPANWVGTKGEYGQSNDAGSGVYNTPSIVPVTTSDTNVSNLLIGFDQLPTTTTQLYTIPYPTMNAQKALIPANGLGILAGSDPEDGTYTAGSTFTITSLAGMQGNTLYYDANGDGILQSYEQITGYTTITNFDPSKLYVKFVGAGSTHATFDYGSTDAAGKTDPAPASYTIQWIGTLPVKMLYFNAEKSGETQSLLTWATASELDNAYFDVERSPDAQNWEQIGQVPGAGTTDIQTNYSMVDAEPLSGPNYYRLKQVDVDGNASYSEVAEVTFTSSPVNNTTLTVYPNPLNQANKLNIELSSTDENITDISLVNAIGQTVYKTVVPQIQNYQVIGLDLPAGVYVVSVRTQNNNVITSRLVIQK